MTHSDDCFFDLGGGTDFVQGWIDQGSIQLRVVNGPADDPPGDPVEMGSEEARYLAQVLLILADRLDESEGETPEALAAELGITFDAWSARQSRLSERLPIRARYPDFPDPPPYGAGRGWI